MKTGVSQNSIGIRSEAGLSLVELMVALVIGLILTAGVISVYLTSKKSYNADTGLAQVQENGRFALSFLEPPIRMAGYMGCTHTTPINHLQATVTTGYDFNKALEGYDASGTNVGDTLSLPSSITVDSNSADWSPNPPSDIFNVIDPYTIKGSDILVLHEAAGVQLPIMPDGGGNYQQSAGVFLPEGSESKVSVGEIAIVADCTKSSLFQITTIQDTGQASRLDHSSNSGLSPGNTGPVWPSNEAYGQGASLSLAQTFVFFVGRSGVDGSPALFEVAYNTGGQLSTPTELVPNIENMQILYGVDTDSDRIPDQFISAADVTDWSKVICVRIALITRSDDLTADQKPSTAQTFDLNGVTVTAPVDRRIRRVFTQTISLRNMLP